MSVILLVLVVGVISAGIGAAAALYFSQERTKTRPITPNKHQAEMTCTVCHKPMSIAPERAKRLSSVEIALVARSRPGVVGHPLYEIVCPHCEAAHCFMRQEHNALWLGVNFYEPQEHSSRCAECGKRVRSAEWPQGPDDALLHKAPHANLDHALICPACHRLVCLGCCIRMTKNRFNDHSLMCPRCGHHPITTFYREIPEG